MAKAGAQGRKERGQRMGAGTERGSWELLCPFLEEPGWAAIAVPAAGLCS